MRLLILSQYYTPEPVPKPSELAQEFHKRGHTVSVITGFPNYPGGVLYPGFSLSPVKSEQCGGISIVRTYEYPYHGQRALGRILNYLSFMVSAPLGLLFTPASDVIYVWHPPLTIGISAWIIARIRGIPFIYDVQDIWPEAAVASGLLAKGKLYRILSWLERFVYRQADHILVVTEQAQRNLVDKGVPEQKLSIMRNWIDESLFSDVNTDEVFQVRGQYGWANRFVVLFAGNIGMVQGLETVIQAAAQLPKGHNILVVLIGNGTDKARLQAMVQALHLEAEVQFIDYQPMNQIPRFLAAANVLLVHLKRSKVFEYVIPTKTTAYLAAGRPILIAAEGASVDLINEAQAGLCVPPEDPVAMANAISTLSKMSEQELTLFGQHGRKFLVTNLTKQKVITEYEILLQRFADSKTIRDP